MNISVFSKPNSASQKLFDGYNYKKDYPDYSDVLAEFSKDYYYTTVKINKSKERILIITDEISKNKTSNHGLFYYFGKNGFVYPLGYLESKKPFAYSKKYLYLSEKDKNIKFYMSDKKLSVIKSVVKKINEFSNNIEFEKIKSAKNYYHKPQYKRGYISRLMRECINEGVKTQVQMYCCMVNKLHSENLTSQRKNALFRH